MHPRTEELVAHLDRHRAELETTMSGVPHALRERRPDTGGWSVAEVLEHLTLVEARIGQLLDGRVTAARAAGLGLERDSAPVVPTLDVARVLDRSAPLTASEASQPTGKPVADVAWAALTAQRRAFRTMVVAADGLALGEVMIPHPRLGPLNVYQWVVFVGAHEGRHAAQIREIASRIVKPSV
jgi:DinB superfamily